MKRNISDYIVAISVILCSLVLLAALTFALSGYRLKKPSRTLQINYEDVTGIKVHSEVRYAGAPAGRVIAMRHLTAKEREASPNKKDAVRVTVSLDDRNSAIACGCKCDAQLGYNALAKICGAIRRHARR